MYIYIAKNDTRTFQCQVQKEVSLRFPHILYISRAVVTINTDYCPQHHWPVGLYNTRALCLLWGANLFFTSA